MAILFNTTKEKQTVRAAGNYFTFAPKQIKMMDDVLGHFIAVDKKSYGIVALPQEFEEPEYKQTAEGKAILAQKEKEGLEHFLAFHRSKIHNNQVSLKKDLDRANLKIDPAVFATPQEIESMKIVSEYQAAHEDEAQKKIDQVQELMSKVKKAK